MTVRLDIDETIEHIYEKPKLILKTIKNGTQEDEPIHEVSELFSTSDDPMAKIIVEGDVGTGKTSLCKKIVDDWRKEKENVEKASKLSKFEFVFFIILRDAKTESDIKNMIFQQILKNIDSDYEHEHSLLGEILKKEHCLLLFDGLDEWRGKMPHVETSWRNCTTLITTRPYKLADLKVSLTQVDKHVQLDGVKDPENFVLKVIQKLEEIHKTNKEPKSCQLEIKKKGLWHFRENPVVLVHIVWLWHNNKLRETISRTALYQEIFDERWLAMCDKNETDIDRHKLFDLLSEIAFDKLFSENEDESLVFNIKEPHLEKFKQFKEASLASGILSGSNVPGERFHQYQFLHKTFQEYLAAIFLSKRGSKLSSSCKIVKNIHSKHRNESVFALEQVFLFLCGLNPEAAKQFSETLNELFTENCEETGSAREAYRFQSMIFKGYDEAERNKHIGADFCLQHVKLPTTNIYWLTESQRLKIKLCLHDRKSSLVSLSILGRNDVGSIWQHKDCPKFRPDSLSIRKNNVWSTLQYKDDQTVLVVFSKNLKFVELDDVPFEDINLLNLYGLVRCDIRFKDYKQASKLVASVQSSDLRCLKHLVLKNVGLECEAVDILSKLKCVKELDLTWSKASRLNDSPFDFEHLKHLEDLNSLTFREFPFFDVVVNSQLRKLERLHIGFRTQQRVPMLMTALLQNFKGSLTAVPKGPHFTQRELTLGKVHMSAEVYKRLVNMVLQWKDDVNFNLIMCTIEEDITQVQEEMGNQPSLQMVAPQAASTDFQTAFICLWDVSVPAELLRRLVIMVLQSRRVVTLSLAMCIIEDDIKQGQEEMGNQPALQVVAPQAASNNTNIDLQSTPVSAEMFRRLVSVVIQSRKYIILRLEKCTLKENIKQVQKEIRNKHARQIKRFRTLSDLTTCIEFYSVTLSAEVFRRFVSEVLQLVRSLDIWINKCTLEEDITQVQEEMGNQSALQVVAPQAASTDYTTNISLEDMTVSAEVFRHL